MQVIAHPGMKLEDVEKMHILQTYQFCRNNKKKTSECLGIALRTLDNKLEKYKKESDLEETRVDEEQRKREEFLRRSRGIHNAQFGQASGTDRSRDADFIPADGSKPVNEVRPQQDLPVQERTEVQSVLPVQVTALRNGSGGPRISRTDGFS